MSSRVQETGQSWAIILVETAGRRGRKRPDWPRAGELDRHEAGTEGTGCAKVNSGGENWTVLRRPFLFVRNQAQHHQKMTFQDEYRWLLERYHVAFGEKYALD